MVSPLIVSSNFLNLKQNLIAFSKKYEALSTTSKASKTGLTKTVNLEGVFREETKAHQLIFFISCGSVVLSFYFSLLEFKSFFC